MSITAESWSNKNGTANRTCKCGTWKEHWIKFANKAWPTTCSVQGCTNKPTLGAHVVNQSVSGEKIRNKWGQNLTDPHKITHKSPSY